MDWYHLQLSSILVWSRLVWMCSSSLVVFTICGALVQLTLLGNLKVYAWNTVSMMFWPELRLRSKVICTPLMVTFDGSQEWVPLFSSNYNVPHGLTSLIFIFLSLPLELLIRVHYSVIYQILWFKFAVSMVPDHDWLTNFKLGVIGAAWDILALIYLMHFSEVVGLVLPQFEQFFQNYLAFIVL